MIVIKAAARYPGKLSKAVQFLERAIAHKMRP